MLPAGQAVGAMPSGGQGTALVVRSHHPLRPQELRLFVGQRVCVRFRHATSGWYEGTAMGSGESGWFPGECVDDDYLEGDYVELSNSQPQASPAGTAGIAVTMPKTPACSWPHTGGVQREGAEGGGKPRQGGVGLLLEHTGPRRRLAHSAAGTGAFIVSGVVPGFPAQQCGLIQRDDVLCKVDRYTLNSSLKVQDVNTLIRFVTVCVCVCRQQQTYACWQPHTHACKCGVSLPGERVVRCAVCGAGARPARA